MKKTSNPFPYHRHGKQIFLGYDPAIHIADATEEQFAIELIQILNASTTY